jgi:hypothetical protein
MECIHSLREYSLAMKISLRMDKHGSAKAAISHQQLVSGFERGNFLFLVCFVGEELSALHALTLSRRSRIV